MCSKTTRPGGFGVKKGLKTAGMVTILFFTVKGIISSALLLWGGSHLLRGCFG